MTERKTMVPLMFVPLGDMFVKGIVIHYNLSIKANDFVVSKNSDKFWMISNPYGFQENKKYIKNYLY